MITDIIEPAHCATFQESIAQSARDLTPWHWEGVIVLSDGTRKWLQGISRPHRYSNGDIVWDGLLTDISARREREAAVESARREAERANHAKSEFIGRMSHELRTPLNAILGFGQLLELEQLRPNQTESVEQIMAAGHHLLELINEVLDIARIESGQQTLHLETLDVCEAARQVCELVRPLATQNGIALELCFGADCCGPARCGAARVNADAQRFKQILLNLCSNAIKYAGRGARVKLTCAALEGEDGPMIALAVSDDGPGIAAHLQERVWTPFDRIGAESSATEGAGMGLPLARILAQAMGGQLTLQSAPGQGCTFVLQLPRAPDPTNAQTEAPSPNSNEFAADRAHDENDADADACAARSFRVLYIEDNASNTQLVRRLVERQPALSLLTAARGDEGLELARQARPDLILLDLQLARHGRRSGAVPVATRPGHARFAGRGGLGQRHRRPHRAPEGAGSQRLPDQTARHRAVPPRSGRATQLGTENADARGPALCCV